jgi:hypothetical protein
MPQRDSAQHRKEIEGWVVPNDAKKMVLQHSVSHSVGIAANSEEGYIS